MESARWPTTGLMLPVRRSSPPIRTTVVNWWCRSGTAVTTAEIRQRSLPAI